MRGFRTHTHMHTQTQSTSTAYRQFKGTVRECDSRRQVQQVCYRRMQFLPAVALSFAYSEEVQELEQGIGACYGSTLPWFP